MILTSLPEWKAYHEALATELGLTLVYGSSERVLRRQMEGLEYPMAWLAMPDVSILPDHNERYSTTMFFLTDAENEEGQEDDAIEAMYAKARAYHLRLKQDGNQGFFGYGDSETVLQVKPRVTGDNDHGYVMDFDMIIYPQDEC